MHDTSGRTTDAHSAEAMHAWWGQFGNAYAQCEQNTSAVNQARCEYLSGAFQRVDDVAREAGAPL
jgi:hypothetical protein